MSGKHKNWGDYTEPHVIHETFSHPEITLSDKGKVRFGDVAQEAFQELIYKVLHEIRTITSQDKRYLPPIGNIRIEYPEGGETKVFPIPAIIRSEDWDKYAEEKSEIKAILESNYNSDEKQEILIQMKVKKRFLSILFRSFSSNKNSDTQKKGSKEQEKKKAKKRGEKLETPETKIIRSLNSRKDLHENLKHSTASR